MRSSATAEDLPDASFAGQQETYLNIRGVDNVLEAVRRVFASLYNDRAIAYRVHKGFTHAEVSISAGVQRMVRSDLGAAGVMFTMDTESGFREVVFITSSYGLGETVVQGAVNPDEFYVSKLCLANGKPAILRRGLGTKAIKLVFDTEAKAGKSVKEVEVPPQDARPLLALRCRGRGARALRDVDREALRPPHGHRVGPRRRGRQALHPAGAPRDGEEPGEAQGTRSRATASASAARCSPRAAPSARRSARGACA